MRRILLTALVSLLVVSAGCVGLITGETVEFEANNATNEDSTLDSTGYELNNSTERSITRDVEFAGQERTIRVVNQVNRYTSSGNLANITDNETLASASENESLAAQREELAAENETLSNAVENETGGSATQVAALSRFVVVSTPSASVAGQTLNPAADWSNERILNQVSDQTGSLDNTESDGSRETESLGESREVSEFTGTTEIAGQEVDVRIHVTSFEHEGDIIIAVGVHPEELDETENIDELLSGLQHESN